MNFIPFDVETANPDLSSICQIGIARFANGTFTEKWESLVNPDDYFDPMNISVHGIDESMVADAPKFPALSDELIPLLSKSIVVAHTHFDQAAVRAVFSKYGLTLPSITWLDTARVVRRTWLDLSQSGYGLRNVAEKLGIDFQHHNAAEDARAAGEILLRAVQESGLSVEDWVVRSRKPIGSSTGNSERITRDGNPEGPLYGEVALFTGELSIPRRDAADLAAAAGCKVIDSFSKAITLLIVGDQDIRVLAGHEKSSKHRKTEELIAKEQSIRILRETDFRNMTSMSE